MKSIDDDKMEEVLSWCASVLGPFEVVSEDSRAHPGQRASTLRLRTSSGICYVKTHRDRSHWDSEVHGYEQWSPAFGDFTPKLLAVRDEEPLALVISELPGKILDEVELSTVQACEVWRSAGRALATLHNTAIGEYFGPCRRDGVCAGKPIDDAREYVLTDINNWLVRGRRGSYLNKDDLTIVAAANEWVPAFEGERPVACHRDYGPANWLVSSDGVWTGVIDFEFSYWDVRATDFARYPNWEWIDQPERIGAFFEGYGRSFTPREEQQRLVAQALYALGAIVWGMENAYYSFAREGRRALQTLKGRLK